MRPVIAAALVLVAALAVTVQPAQALTIRDVIELTRAGLTDDVLVALIEVDGGVYSTDTATLKSLKDAGVSDRVMIALIRSGRDRRVEEPPPVPVVDDASVEAPPPPTVVIEHRGVIEHREPQVQQVVVPVPVYVPVYPTRGRSAPLRGVHWHPGEHIRALAAGRGREAAKGTGARAGVLGIRREAASRCLGPAAGPRQEAVRGRRQGQGQG